LINRQLYNTPCRFFLFNDEKRNKIKRGGGETKKNLVDKRGKADLDLSLNIEIIFLDIFMWGIDYIETIQEEPGRACYLIDNPRSTTGMSLPCCCWCVAFDAILYNDAHYLFG
jgi:hypothetical protein